MCAMNNLHCISSMETGILLKYQPIQQSLSIAFPINDPSITHQKNCLSNWSLVIIWTNVNHDECILPTQTVLVGDVAVGLGHPVQELRAEPLELEPVQLRGWRHVLCPPVTLGVRRPRAHGTISAQGCRKNILG